MSLSNRARKEGMPQEELQASVRAAMNTFFDGLVTGDNQSTNLEEDFAAMLFDVIERFCKEADDVPVTRRLRMEGKRSRGTNQPPR